MDQLNPILVEKIVNASMKIDLPINLSLDTKKGIGTGKRLNDIEMFPRIGVLVVAWKRRLLVYTYGERAGHEDAAVVNRVLQNGGYITSLQVQGNYHQEV